MSRNKNKIKTRRVGRFVFEDRGASWACYPFERERFHEVRVYKPGLAIEDGKTIIPDASVSWASFIEKDNERVCIYAEAISTAARFADYLNEEITSPIVPQK